MNNILLLSSSIEDESRAPIINPNTHYPLGLAYLHSYLEECGNRVETLFLNDYPLESCSQKVIDTIREFKPDIVGFQIITHNRISSFHLIEYIHENYPHIQIIVGGIHTTLMYDQILNKFPYLIAVLGEGEITCGELIKKLENGESIEDVAGIAYLNENGLVKTKARDLISNLDSLPFPKHEIFFDSGRIYANIITSRGCPCACSFCVLDSISRRKVRFRSVENVIAEIEYLISSFPDIQCIWIHDDSFFLDNQRVINICDEIVRRNIKLKFICSGRVKPLSKELVKALERAGFTNVLFGLESGAAKVLKLCRKGVTKEDIINAFELFAGSPISITAFLIVGLYGENDETVMETANFIQQLQKIKYTYYDEIGVLIIYPGTEIYEIAKGNGMISDDYWLTDKPVPFFTAEHSLDKLDEYKEKIRDYIALKKIFTLKGFKAQKKLLPYIIKYYLNDIPLRILRKLRFLCRKTFRA